MVELYEAGRVKAIGVSNFSSAKLYQFRVDSPQGAGQ